MRLAYQFAAFILLALGCLYAGILNFLSPSDVLTQYFGLSLLGMDTELRLALESQIRLLAGMWIAAGGALFFSLKEFEKHTILFRLVMSGLILGTMGEIFARASLGEPVAPAVMKTVFQFFLCGGLELWRLNLVRKVGRVEA